MIKRTGKIKLGFVTAIAALTVVAASAIAATGSEPATSERWTWTDGVPGRATSDARSRAAAARTPGIASAVREVVSVGSGVDRNVLLASKRNAGSAVCLAGRLNRISSQFHCLTDDLDRFAMIYFASSGGASVESVDRGAVIGIARADVERVIVVTTDGGRQELALNRWRAFSYEATSPRRVPAKLQALAAGGVVLQEADLAFAPPGG